jgi:hypothetical protein
LFNPSTSTFGAREVTLEYVLTCGHVKQRKTVPPTPVGSTMFCWTCHRHAVVESRDVVLVAPRRRRRD